ncbi:translation initiation factor 2 [Pseudomonas sp. RIT-PI-a]|uniref:translation initiation factor 2 n=1 Tax=Pseudomonas sp. RIT-PI-a TaxID=1681194 RepID=UPI000AEE31E0|nr:translation initiation factor 2 [Pseudomonas sp. RIT-PI-a]
MNTMRRIALLVFCLNLGVFAVPCVQAQTSESPSSAARSAETDKPVVKTDAPAKKAVAKKPAVRKKAAKSRSRKESDVIATPVPEAKLDLSLPKDIVKDLKPPTQPVNAAVQPTPLAERAPKPILPAFFSDKGNEDFQLNGRLLNNEMQLQRRGDGREVEGAALDFNFKQ